MGEVPDYDDACFLSFVPAGVSADELANALKVALWRSGREHAVLRLTDGRLALVSGGSKGMILRVRSIDLGLPPRAVVAIDGRDVAVNELVLHIHPFVTGPSRADFEVLELLGQESSVLIELNGDGPTRFFRPSKR